MNKILFVIFCIVTGLLLSVAGFFIGTLTERSATGPIIAKEKVLISALNSNVITLVAAGQIKSVSGRTIILGNSQQDITIIMKEGIDIINERANFKEKPKISLSDLKVGDSLQVFLSILPSGEIQAERGSYLSEGLRGPSPATNTSK